MSQPDFATAIDLFQARVREGAEQTAFRYYDDRLGDWREISWQDYGVQVMSGAAWLQKQGVGAGDRVGILSGNRPEWIMADLAILAAGAVSVPIYPTASLGDKEFILGHSEVKLIFIDNTERLTGMRESLLDNLKIVVFETGSKTAGLEGAALWAELSSNHINPLASAVTVRGDDLATIIYTSGTTGQPKGVMHTHGNLAAATKSLHAVLYSPDTYGKDLFFSFLPLSHAAERCLVELGSLVCASPIVFARSVATLGEDLVKHQPTILLCVPRLWEKMCERIQLQVFRAPALKQRIFHLAKWLGSARIRGDALSGGGESISSRLSDLLVGKSLRHRLGLSRTRLLLTGSAPTRPDVLRFFASFGIPLVEVYGLTENLAMSTYDEIASPRIGTCGKPFFGNEIHIAADGEICLRAPYNFVGYYRNPEATSATLIEIPQRPGGRWFATGDLGELTPEGLLRITGRKKELIKTSTGKYVAPVPIEDRIKALPWVVEAMVVGDSQKYCVAILALDHGRDLAGSQKELSEHLNAVNRDLASHESIKRLGIMCSGFSVEDGTLTPTLKVKRQAATQKHQKFIDRIYQSAEMIVMEAE